MTSLSGSRASAGTAGTGGYRAREQVEPELEVAVDISRPELRVQLRELRELGWTQPCCGSVAIPALAQPGSEAGLAHQQTREIGGDPAQDPRCVGSANARLPQGGKRRLARP
jgi:hypothetical protein